ncbi:MAG: putative protein N(5)-glutamine methyltransferase [Rhodoglobus sp.]
MPQPAPTERAIVDRLRAAGCVFAEDEARLLIAEDSADLESMVTRRVAGEPLEYILGWAEFCGLRIEVEPGVFVPRQRTGYLVKLAVKLAEPGSVVVDLCCGAGAIGAALAVAVPGVELYAADLDPAAVACAHRNLDPIGGQVFEGDLYAPLPAALRGRVDVLAVNAPYVPTDEIALMPPEAREHEHRMALDGGADGLDFHRRVAAEAPAWLTPGGSLLIETSTMQAARTAAIFEAAGLATRVKRSKKFYSTVVIGVLR